MNFEFRMNSPEPINNKKLQKKEKKDENKFKILREVGKYPDLRSTTTKNTIHMFVSSLSVGLFLVPKA